MMAVAAALMRAALRVNIGSFLHLNVFNTLATLRRSTQQGLRCDKLPSE
jgi:hypothetical protein